MRKVLKKMLMPSLRRWFKRRNDRLPEEYVHMSFRFLIELMTSSYQGGKTRLERITAAAHARHAATFNPQLHVERVKKQNKPRRRVSMGVVMDAATGEVLGDAPEESVAGKRKSRRKMRKAI